MVTALVVALAAGCKSGTPPESSTVISIVITPSPASVKPGQTLQLSAKVLGPPGIQQGVNWRSLNTQIATISSSGLVTGVAEGPATIRATWIEDSEEFTTIEVLVTATPIGEGEQPRVGGVLSAVRKKR
jgi:uncharacterized protein YjdB